jgi:hypothetical protein
MFDQDQAADPLDHGQGGPVATYADVEADTPRPVAGRELPEDGLAPVRC